MLKAEPGPRLNGLGQRFHDGACRLQGRDEGFGLARLGLRLDGLADGVQILRRQCQGVLNGFDGQRIRRAIGSLAQVGVGIVECEPKGGVLGFQLRRFVQQADAGVGVAKFQVHPALDVLCERLVELCEQACGLSRVLGGVLEQGRVFLLLPGKR